MIRASPEKCRFVFNVARNESEVLQLQQNLQQDVHGELCLLLCVRVCVCTSDPPSPTVGPYREGVDLLGCRRSSARPLAAAPSGRLAGKQEGSGALPSRQLNSTPCFFLA